LCWGGKIASLGGDFGGKVKVAAQCHPAMLDPNDALKITIPFATLASGDEKEADVVAFGENLRGEKVLEIFRDQKHGWMTARYVWFWLAIGEDDDC
jgi:dienelactone hydrolase